MSAAVATALEIAGRIRRSRGYAQLAPDERAALDRDLARLEATLGAGDPYALPLETPNDLRFPLPGQGPSGRQGAPTSGSAPIVPAAGSAPAAGTVPRTGTDQIGERARRTLDAIDFPAFVASLVTGTFRSIVDATAQQMREYADLVASLTRTVEEFSEENVTPDQVRDWMVERHPADLQVVVPPPGRNERSRLVPRDGRPADPPPAWLERFGLGGQEFTPELTDGPLVEAGRRTLGEERLQTLATMVLMGVNRIVVDQGQIRARLQFHAAAQETARAEMVAQMQGQQVGIAARTVQLQSTASTMVSTLSVNAQADASIRTDLMGEVSIQFRTETFPLERFADSPAIQLLSRHANWQPAAPAASAGTAPAVGRVPGAPPSPADAGGGA